MKIEVVQISLTCPPIDAEFHADFRNALVYKAISIILRDIRDLLPYLTKSGTRAQNQQYYEVSWQYLAKYSR